MNDQNRGQDREPAIIVEYVPGKRESRGRRRGPENETSRGRYYYKSTRPFSPPALAVLVLAGLVAVCLVLAIGAAMLFFFLGAGLLFIFRRRLLKR